MQVILFTAFSQERFVIGFICFKIKDEKKYRACEMIF